MKKTRDRKSNKNKLKEIAKKLSRLFVEKWHLSLLSVLIGVFLVQLLWGVVINSAKIYSLNMKIAKLEKIDKMAERKNKFLREELEKYTSNSGVEALARNRLHFSKEDETLVIIKTPHANEEEF